MKKCAVFIGINKAKGLPALSAAVESAEQMNLWALGQGFATNLFTDRDDTVKVQSIFDAIEALLKDQPEQLIIYFAGHGFLPTPGNEKWLLSNALYDGGEAIDLNQNKWLAYNCGLKSVIFISDACRGLAKDYNLLQIIGRPVFPNLSIQNKTRIDILYATHPGAVAHEVKNEDGSYTGIYTECMLECLEGNVQKVIKELTGASERTFVVFPNDLNVHLEDEVPRQILKRGLFIRQQPTGEVTSQSPVYVSKVNKQPDVSVFYPEPDGDYESTVDDFGGGGEGALNAPAAPHYGIPDEYELAPATITDRLNKLIGTGADRSAMDAEVQYNMSIIAQNADSPGLLPTEWRESGLRVRGLINYRLYEEPGIDRLIPVGGNLFLLDSRIDSQIKNILICGIEGTPAVPVSVLPGFMCYVVFHRGKLVSVDYVPVYDNYRRRDYEHFRSEIVQRKAKIVTAAKYGIFQGSEEIGDYIRRYKSLDPTLGLFATYAYMQQGKREQVRDVYRYMSREPEPVLMDVELLNYMAGDHDRWDELHSFSVPLLTQGWSYFSLIGPEDARRLAGMLVPGLWTTFSREGMFLIIERFNLRKI